MERLIPQQMQPSTYLAGDPKSKHCDTFCRDYFLNFHDFFIRRGLDDYNLRRLEAAAFSLAPILISSGRDFSQATAIELGCGQGLKAFPIARMFKRYIGIDLEHDAIRDANAVNAALGIEGLEFICGNATEVVTQPEKFGLERIDVLFLHAVMEHLTAIERVSIFALMRIVRERGGSIILLETPNRLIPFDQHSSQLHFVDHLPDDLAYEYIRQNTSNIRAKEFVCGGFYDAGDTRPLNASERSVLLKDSDSSIRLYRLGRGMSYHDFELYYQRSDFDFSPEIDGFHPLLLNHQPLCRQETWLEDYFSGNNLPVHRAFSRVWIDFFDFNADGKKASRRARVTRPTLYGQGRIDLRAEFWSLDNFLVSGQGELVIALDESPSQVTILFETVAPNQVARVDSNGSELAIISFEELAEQRPPIWHNQFAVPIALPDGTHEIRIRSGNGNQVLCHGVIGSDRRQ